jgi:tetratricopeptide (TPR) repeat protein
MNARLLLLLLLPLFGVNAHAADNAQECEKALAAGNYADAAKSGYLAGGFTGSMCAGRALLASDDAAGAAAAFAAAEKSARDGFEQMLAITFLARASRDAGNADAALSHYERSLKIAEQIDAKQGIMVNLNESAQVLQNKGNPQQALERYQRAYQVAANDNERAETNRLIASAYRDLKDYDKAIEYQLKSMLAQQRSGDPDQFLEAKLELADIAVAAGDYSRAQKELEESLKISESAGSEYWRARTMLFQARLEAARGNAERAKQLRQDALALANKIGAKALAAQISTESGK